MQFSSVQSLSCVWIFVTPWIAAHQASLSITNSRNLHKLMSIKWVIPSSHLILCCPLLLLPPIPPSISLSFPISNSLHEVAKVLEPGLKNFEHYFTSMWDECNCVVVCAFFGIAFLSDWNENLFSSPAATSEFSKFAGILSAALSQLYLLRFVMAYLELHHLHQLCS